MIYIVMGVSGCGKTTIGKLLARRLKLPFYDADDFHPPTSVSKMRSGKPLTDEDRQAWLDTLGSSIREWESRGGAVLACSALKEKYRKAIQTIPAGHLTFIHLSGEPAIIAGRLRNRQNHYMPESLLYSQLEALEPPPAALQVDIKASPEEIVDQIINSMKNNDSTSEFGLIGLGVMGKSLALNLAGKNIRVAIYNRHVPGKEEGVAESIIIGNPEIKTLKGFDDLKAFVQHLERPRRIFLMIMAGAPVDSQLADLLPLLEPGDVVMDGGNSFYKDTERRTRELATRGIHFVGTGVSGGEEGALKGPAIMPGGPEEGYALVAKYFELIAARDKNGKPCTTYVGQGGAGHFVKMVHNGIEYAEMQLLAEIYALMRFYLQMQPEEMTDVLQNWQQSDLNSYLLSITIDILQVKEGEDLLLDKVLDQAEQKGTGGWSTTAALEHGAPFSIISEAVMARIVSSQKVKRVQANDVYQPDLQTINSDKPVFLKRLKRAYQAARILNHEMGFSMMQQVAAAQGWEMNWSEIARIWTNGCIIRSGLMEELAEILKTEKELLLAPPVVSRLRGMRSDLAFVVAEGLQHGFALPVFSAALNYFYGSQTASSPANLIQAQRDYFGAHTFRRTDKGPDQSFHADWRPEAGKKL